MPQPLDDATVYNETLISLGNLKVAGGPKSKKGKKKK